MFGRSLDEHKYLYCHERSLDGRVRSLRLMKCLEGAIRKKAKPT